MENKFVFKQFEVIQQESVMKVGTDGVLLGAWADVDNADTGLDIGTGTGVIALMLAQRSPSIRVVGVEVDPKAYQEAQENAEQSNWSERIEIVIGQIQDFSRSYQDDLFDIIVCNPPFFSGGTLSFQDDKNTVRHTVKLPHGELLIAARRLLSKKGRFAVVLPYLEGLRFIDLAKRGGFSMHRQCVVHSFEDQPAKRMLIELGFEPNDSPEISKLSIYKEENVYSDAYKELTKDFYLNM